MTFTDVKDELHQLLDETRREIRGSADGGLSGVGYSRMLRRKDALSYLVNLLTSLSQIYKRVFPGYSIEGTADVPCVCGHAAWKHLTGLRPSAVQPERFGLHFGTCLELGCTCREWETP